MHRGLRTCSSSWMPWQTRYTLRPLLVSIRIAACCACASAAVGRSITGDTFRYALVADYWACVARATALGWVGSAVNLLCSHSAMQRWTNSPTKSVDVQAMVRMTAQSCCLRGFCLLRMLSRLASGNIRASHGLQRLPALQLRVLILLLFGNLS